MERGKSRMNAVSGLMTFGHSVWGLPRMAIFIRWQEVCKGDTTWQEKHPVLSTTRYCGEDCGEDSGSLGQTDERQQQVPN